MIVIIIALKYGKSYSSSHTCLSNDCMPWEISLLFVNLYMVMHITLMSPTVNNPFTGKFPVTWWQKIHQVTRRSGTYTKLGARFDSVTLML